MKKNTRRFLNKLSKIVIFVGFVYLFLLMSNDDYFSRFTAFPFQTKQFLIGIGIVIVGAIIYLISRFNSNALKKRK